MRLAPSLVQQARLLLARAVAGSTTVGGSAAGCVRRLHYTCQAESQDCQQHNCSKFLHGFSPLRNQKWFCGPMAMPSAGEQEKLARVISRCEAGGWRGAYPGRCAKRAGEFSQNDSGGMAAQIEIGRGKEIAGRRDVQRDRVGLGSDGDFHGTAGHGSAASGVRLAGRGGSVAAGMMRAVGHVGHAGDQVRVGLGG